MFRIRPFLFVVLNNPRAQLELLANQESGLLDQAKYFYMEYFCIIVTELIGDVRPRHRERQLVSTTISPHTSFFTGSLMEALLCSGGNFDNLISILMLWEGIVNAPIIYLSYCKNVNYLLKIPTTI